MLKLLEIVKIREDLEKEEDLEEEKECFLFQLILPTFFRAVWEIQTMAW